MNSTNAAAAFARVSGACLGGQRPRGKSTRDIGRRPLRRLYLRLELRSERHEQRLDDVYRRDMNSNNAAAFARVSGLASVPNDRGRKSTLDIGRRALRRLRLRLELRSKRHERLAEDVYRRDMNSTNAAAFARVSGLASVPNDRGGNQPSISGDGRPRRFHLGLELRSERYERRSPTPTAVTCVLNAAPPKCVKKSARHLSYLN